MKFYRLLFTCVCVPFFTFGSVNASTSFSDSTSAEMSPLEDLMSEHGALNRIMTIYEEIIRRIKHKESFPEKALYQSAKIIKEWIEDHHERLEEELIFTPLEKAGILVDVIKTLREQHIAGRKLTNYILDHANEKGLKTDTQRQEMKNTLMSFITMYRVHEAREDTEVFPALKKLLTPAEYAELGEVFEKKEHSHFGGDPLDRYIAQITKIEKKLGIHDLNQFTPKS